MSNLDKSLDDLIKMNKQSGGGRLQNSGGSGATRRLQNRSANRAAPYSVRQVQAPDMNWQHNMFADHASAADAYPAAQTVRVSAIETGTKLIISNLDYGVSEQDIKELYSEAGEVKRYSIHYDRSGRSKGTAEVVFSRRRDAEAAVKRYHNVQLDGKHMKLEIVGRNIATPAVPAAIPPSSREIIYGNQNTAPRSNHSGRASGIGRHRRGGGGGGGGRFSRGGRYEKKVSSAEDLDADLDNYHAAAAATGEGKPEEMKP